MRKLKNYMLSILFIIGLANFTNATAEDSFDDFPTPLGAQWGKIWAESSLDSYARSIIAISDSYVVAGRQNGPTGPQLDYWTALVRLRGDDGEVTDWNTFDSEDDHNEAYDILATYDGETLAGYSITGAKHQSVSILGEGETIPEEYYNPHVWLMRVGTDLEKDWENTYGDPFSDYGYASLYDGTGYVLVGQYSNPNESGYVIRTDATGDLEWDIYNNIPLSLNPVVYSVSQAFGDSLVLATEEGIYKINIALPLALDWSAESDKFHSIVTVGDGYVATGSVDISGDTSHTDLVLVKINTDGTRAWYRTYGRSSPVLGATGMNDIGREVIQTDDGGFAIIGSTGSYAWHGGSDMWLIKTDANGYMEWDIVMGDAGNDYGYGIIQDEDNALVVAGNAEFSGNNWMYVAKFLDGFMPPIPSFTYSPESPFSIQISIQFDASGSEAGDSADSILLYEWDFGDGQSGTGIIADHIYVAPGDYTVTLYVTDSNGIRRETSQTVTAEGLEMQWERTFGRGLVDIVEGVGGNFLLCGSKCITTLNCNVWATKVNAFGNIIWEFVYPDSYSYEARDGARKGILAHDGNYIIAGFRDKAATYEYRDVRILKLDASDGTKIWDKFYDLGHYDEAFDVKSAPSGGYIVAGAGSAIYGAANIDAWLIKIDENGDEEWNQLYSNTGDDPLRGIAVTPTDDGGYLVVCSEYNSFSDQPIISIKTNSLGVEQWRHTIPDGEGNDKTGGTWVHQREDGNFTIAGSLYSDYALITLDEEGGSYNDITWDGGYRDFIDDADITPDGGYVMTGTQYDAVNDDDVYIVRTDNQGNIAWQFTMGEPGVGGENGDAIAYLSDGSVVVLSSDYYDNVTRLTKFGGNLVPTADFTYDPTDINVGVPVTFTADVNDEDGAITHMIWQFGADQGDPTVTTEETIEHIYASAGTYTVTFTAFDNSGAEIAVTQDLTVTEGSITELVPLHRYFNPDAEDHFYITIRNDPLLAFFGYQYECIEAYVYNEQVEGTVPLHRYFNPDVKDHFYIAIRNDPLLAFFGYQYECIEAYVFNSSDR